MGRERASFAGGPTDLVGRHGPVPGEKHGRDPCPPLPRDEDLHGAGHFARHFHHRAMRQVAEPPARLLRPVGGEQPVIRPAGEVMTFHHQPLPHGMAQPVAPFLMHACHPRLPPAIDGQERDIDRARDAHEPRILQAGAAAFAFGADEEVPQAHRPAHPGKTGHAHPAARIVPDRAAADHADGPQTGQPAQQDRRRSARQGMMGQVHAHPHERTVEDRALRERDGDIGRGGRKIEHLGNMLRGIVLNHRLIHRVFAPLSDNHCTVSRAADTVRA